jgi:membrane protease YdiL (CAAX protease family)
MRTALPSLTTHGVKPLLPGPAGLFFAVPALALVIAAYWGIPALANRGMADFTAYMIALLIPLALMFAAALAAYHLEGHPLTWAGFSDRYRLQKMNGRDWLLTLGGLVAAFLGIGLMSTASRGLIEAGLVPLPGYIPPAIDPFLSMDLEVFRLLMGPGAVGNWGLVALLAALLFFNIIGEELWWRGYILPRQELVHGRWTWVIHGGMWTLFHAFKYWDWLALLPVCLVIAYIAQHRQNTWPGIVIHFLINGAIFIPVLMVVLDLGN